MNVLAQIVRLIARVLRFVVIGLAAAWLVRTLLAWMGWKPEPSPAKMVQQNARRMLHRDPWCGSFVSAEISYPLEHSGQVFHFCSAECREHWKSAGRLKASA